MLVSKWITKHPPSHGHNVAGGVPLSDPMLLSLASIFTSAIEKSGQPVVAKARAGTQLCWSRVMHLVPLPGHLAGFSGRLAHPGATPGL